MLLQEHRRDEVVYKIVRIPDVESHSHQNSACFLSKHGKCSIEHEQARNGQAIPITDGARSKIPSERWEQIKTAHASGIGLREIARNMAKLAALPTEVIATATEYACDQIVSFLPCN